MKPVFYKSRDGKYYTKLTKSEIKNQSDMIILVLMNLY